MIAPTRLAEIRVLASEYRVAATSDEILELVTAYEALREVVRADRNTARSADWSSAWNAAYALFPETPHD